MSTLERVITRLRLRRSSPLGKVVKLRPAQARRLLAMTDVTREDEVDCGAVQNLIDQYAEALARGEDAGRWLPKLRQHFEVCGDCREELEALLQILEVETP